MSRNELTYSNHLGAEFFTLYGYLSPSGGGAYSRAFQHPEEPDIFPVINAGLFVPDEYGERERRELREDIVALAHYYKKEQANWERAVLLNKGGIVERDGHKVLFFPARINKEEATLKAHPSQFYLSLLDTLTTHLKASEIEVDWKELHRRRIKPDMILQKMILLSSHSLSDDSYYKALSLPMNILRTIY